MGQAGPNRRGNGSDGGGKGRGGKGRSGKGRSGKGRGGKGGGGAKGAGGDKRGGGRPDRNGRAAGGRGKPGRSSSRGRSPNAKPAGRKPATRKPADMNRHNAPNTPDARRNSHGRLDVTIPSDFTAGRDVQKKIMADVARHGFTDDSTFAIRIALEEAMVNAIKHGNRLDPGKKVHVEATVTPDRAEITIEDEGPGFDRADVPDPTCDANICRPSGRGILLIESYMNTVRWDRGGRRIHMVKDNEPGQLPRR